MTTDASSKETPGPSHNRAVIIPFRGVGDTYLKAFMPAIGAAIFIGCHFAFLAGNFSLCALIVGPFVILGLTVLHLAVGRIEIDDGYISTRSLLGTRRSIALRDVASDMILMGTEGSKYLEIRTTAGAALQIPDMGFSHDELADLRADIAERVRRATGRDVPTEPPTTDDVLLCFFICLLPVAALVVIKLAQLVRAYFG